MLDSLANDDVYKAARTVFGVASVKCERLTEILARPFRSIFGAAAAQFDVAAAQFGAAAAQFDVAAAQFGGGVAHF